MSSIVPGGPAGPKASDRSPYNWSMRETSPWVIEFVGTFIIGLVFSMASGFSHPIATGAAYMGATYMGAHISGGECAAGLRGGTCGAGSAGDPSRVHAPHCLYPPPSPAVRTTAHFNPVITLTRGIVAFVATVRVKRNPELATDKNIRLERDFTFTKAIAYLFCQLIGGILGCVLGAMALGQQEDVLPRPQVGHTVGEALAAEACFAGILVHVYLVHLVSVHSLHNAFFGLSIGATVIAGMIASQLISGGVFNPAIALGILLANLEAEDAGNVWLYIIGPPIGALFGVIPYYLSEALQHSSTQAQTGFQAGKATVSNKPLQGGMVMATPKNVLQQSALNAGETHATFRERKAEDRTQWLYNAITEFWGTGIVVFTAGLSIGSNNPWAPLATGAAVIAQTFAAGHMSGGLLNPAVLLAHLVTHRHRLEDANRPIMGQLKEAGLYLVAQVAGAVVAGFVVAGVLTNDPYVQSTMAGHNGFQPLLLEAILTAFVCFVSLQVTARCTCSALPVAGGGAVAVSVVVPRRSCAPASCVVSVPYSRVRWPLLPVLRLRCP